MFCLDSLLSLVSLSLGLCVCQEKDLDNESVSLKQGKGNNKKKTHWWLCAIDKLRFEVSKVES